MRKVEHWIEEAVGLPADVQHNILSSVVLLAGLTWDRWFQRASLFKISEQANPFAAAIWTDLVSCVVFYFWHRVRHESEFFWRLCHQLHHSPRRIELLTSFYKHPLEIALNSMLTSGIVFAVWTCACCCVGEEASEGRALSTVIVPD